MFNSLNIKAMEIEIFKKAENMLNEMNDLKAYKKSIETDNAGDWFCDVKQLFPELYNDMKVSICMLFDNKLNEMNEQFKQL